MAAVRSVILTLAFVCFHCPLQQHLEKRQQVVNLLLSWNSHLQPHLVFCFRGDKISTQLFSHTVSLTLSRCVVFQGLNLPFLKKHMFLLIA